MQVTNTKTIGLKNFENNIKDIKQIENHIYYKKCNYANEYCKKKPKNQIQP